MLLYIGIFAVLATLSWIEIFNGASIKKNQRFFITVVATFFLVLSAIRWERGTDWSPYYEYFISIQSIDLGSNDRFELGYKYLNYIVNLISDNYTVFLAICALIVYAFQKKAILNFSFLNLKRSINQDVNLKYENEYPMTMLLIIWTLYLGNVFVVRSTIAYIILFFSIIYIRERRLLLFLVFVTIAALFHRSAIIFLPAYYLYHIRLNKRLIVLVIMLLPLVIYLADDGMLLLTKVLGGSYEYKVNNYLYISNAGNSLSGVINNFLLVGLFILMYFKKFKSNSDQFRGMFNLFLFGVLLYLGTYINSTSLTRIALPYMMTQIVLIPYVFKWIKNPGIKLLVFGVLILYLISRNFSVISTYWDLYIPFKSIFDMDTNVIIY